MKAATARNAGLASCQTCHLPSQPPREGDGIPTCPRCRASLYTRKPHSLARTWALLIAAIILYFPANLLPMTISSTLGSSQTDTILSGVLYFYSSGSLFIALVIFIASVFIPLFKFITLTFLLLSVQCCWVLRPRDLTRLYRVIELTGRWSMVDVFVVTLMVALIKLGAFASLEAGPGGLYFAAVVMLTMLAANSFDPRLIWDALEKKYD